MNRSEMEQRTLNFGIRVVKMVAAMPKNRIGDVLGKQVLRSGTSIGANYYEAGGASSKRHFITTMEVAERETAETCYWLKLIAGAEIVPEAKLTALSDEAAQLRKIIRASIKTAKNAQ